MSECSSSLYALGFAEFLADLLPPSYTVVVPPIAGTGSTSGFAVQNLAGELLVVRVEHVDGRPPA